MPSLFVPPLRGGAEEIAAAVRKQAGRGLFSVGAVEGGQGAEDVAAAVVGQFEDRAAAVRTAILGGAEEIAAAVRNQACCGPVSVGAVEGEEGIEGVAAATIDQLEDRSFIGIQGSRPTLLGGAEEIAVLVSNQVALWEPSGAAAESSEVDVGVGASAVDQLEGSALDIRAVRGGGAEEIAVAVYQQFAGKVCGGTGIGIKGVKAGKRVAAAVVDQLENRAPTVIPPCAVVPKRSPPVSAIKPAVGYDPLVPLKETRVLKV